jgi:hypothetical protein
VRRSPAARWSPDRRLHRGEQERDAVGLRPLRSGDGVGIRRRSARPRRGAWWDR